MEPARPLVNNPATVHPAITEAEPGQEGAPRTIRPVGAPPLPVGSEQARQEQAQRGVISMDRTGQVYTVEATEVRWSADKKRRSRFKQGDKISLGMAQQFGYVDAAGSLLARGGDEQPDVAPDDRPARAGDEAPVEFAMAEAAAPVEGIAPVTLERGEVADQAAYEAALAAGTISEIPADGERAAETEEAAEEPDETAETAGKKKRTTAGRGPTETTEGKGPEETEGD